MSIAKLFVEFCQNNQPENIEVALEYFSVFGGLDEDIDTTIPIGELIEAIILDNFSHFNNPIMDATCGKAMNHALLTGVAMGDSRTHTAFRRARVSKEDGEHTLDELLEANLLTRDKAEPIKRSWLDDGLVSDKLHFETPFMRFWFAFVSPIFQGIKDGEYEEFHKRYNNNRIEFGMLHVEQLSQVLVSQSFSNEVSLHVRSYWDATNDFPIFAKTKDGKIVVGVVKNSKSKLKKSELSKLKLKTKEANIEADIYVIVSKSGFSSELKSLKGDNLKLLQLKNLTKLSINS